MKLLASAIAASLLVPSLVSAELGAPFSYTNFDISYVDVSWDVGPADIGGDGFRLEGSYMMTESLFLRGQFDDYNFDVGPTDVDGSEYQVGVGYRYPIRANLDLVGTLSYVQEELESGGFDIDDDGLGIGAGVRARLADPLEVEAGLRYLNMDDGGSDTGLELRARYYFNPRMAIGLQTALNDDFDTWSLGFRSEF